MKEQRDKIRLTRVFGLIARPANSGDLILSRSHNRLQSVLTHLQSNADDQDIFKACPGIKPEEIKAARAWLCRFGPDPSNPAPLPDGPKGLLLDECMAYTDLPFVARRFGWSSHVEAEGLSRGVMGVVGAHQRKNIDTLIAAFAASHSFGGLLTRDTDFATLRNRPGHPAAGINIFLLNSPMTSKDLCERLRGRERFMKEAMANPPPGLYSI